MFKRTALSAAIFAAFAGSLSTGASAAVDTGAFFDDAKVNGGFYVFARQRDRYDMGKGKYTDNLDHTTALTNIDFSSGYINDFIGFDFGIFAAADVYHNKGAGVDHEFSFVPWADPYSPDWSETQTDDGTSIYKAAVKLKAGNSWAKAGYIQPSGPSGLGVNWNFMPGTYQGAQFGTAIDKLTLTYMWANQYKSPWFKDTYKFEDNSGNTLDYVHSVGALYSFESGLSVDAAFSQSKDFLDTYHIKLKDNFAVAGGKLYLSYQYYGAEDTRSISDDLKAYDGRAHYQALVSSFSTGPYTFRAEATATKAKGNQGYFVYRTTIPNGSSQGSNEIWWDSRSDWNHDGQKAVFVGAWRDLSDLGLTGWRAGASYVYGWDGKPFEDFADQDVELKEEAFNVDVGYTFSEGNLKGSSISVHMTRYNNKSGQDSWEAGGFKNAFQDEKDIKVSLVVPFAL
ncbi:OprD family outer membrane porin [Parendozoicomonas haliclonae]|uniref:Chitoporin n=1 Tax=Parendozoicomonas haliclonae TaxID=1960125 RepID=A0A1X7AP97_9GAMM|nr:OprD family outer membrane porin [Parendozoicomonas haliclonae]SMA49909.1 Chitoporin precursor [Parendozoicomonas haliclonae]